MKFHHIGIATDNIENMIEELKSIFVIKSVSEKVFDDKQNAYLCMVTVEDGFDIELISGLIVENLIKKRQFLYHVCYQVEDIDSQINRLIENGGILISEPKNAILFGGKKVAFLSTNMGLVELVEE
jgi:hypothetical protein